MSINKKSESENLGKTKRTRGEDNDTVGGAGRIRAIQQENLTRVHGLPENVYLSTEEAVLEIAKALNVEMTPNDIDISHKLKPKGKMFIIVKFSGHKIKTKLYKERTKVKNINIGKHLS